MTRVNQVTREVLLVGRHTLRGKHRRRDRRAPLTRSAYSPGRALRTVGLLSGVAVVAAMSLPLGADASALRTPTTRVHLPARAEASEPYVPQDSCDPTAKPGVVAFRTLMLATYKRGRDGGIVRACADGGISEHKEGRAWDWMLSAKDPHDAAVATSVLTWLIKAGPHGELGWNARRFGIMYVIWNGRIWGAYRASEGWRAYVGASEHTDHIHFSFGWDGAWKRTSWWTGKVAATDYGPCAATGWLAPRYRGFNPRPCPVIGQGPVPLVIYVGPNQTGARVLAVQKALGVRPLSGRYGPITAHAVAMWQLRHHLPHTGRVDMATALAMHLIAPPVVVYLGPGARGARVLTLQKALRVRPLSGIYGSATAHAVALWQLHHHLAHTGRVDMATAVAMHLIVPPVAPARTYAGPGNRGAHVLAVQRALGVRPLSGIYGAITAHAVAMWQLHHHLPHTGIVDAATARAMHLPA